MWSAARWLVDYLTHASVCFLPVLSNLLQLHDGGGVQLL